MDVVTLLGRSLEENVAGVMLGKMGSSPPRLIYNLISIFIVCIKEAFV